MDADAKQKLLHENLDTTFVNLWSLLRSLTQKNFVGRVHVELKDYSADILMDGSRTPMVHEIDRAAGTETIEEAALHRVVLRARETPGTITVFEGANKTSTPQGEVSPVSATAAPAAKSLESVSISPAPPSRPVDVGQPRITEEQSTTPQSSKVNTEPEIAVPLQPVAELSESLYRTGSYQDWPAILETTGELIAAIERGLNATGANFGELFNAVRLELADDYSFLDPLTRAFAYTNGVASLDSKPPVNVFVSGLSEALRRTVDRAAIGERVRRVRERVALEMLTVARKRNEVLERSGFATQLDRIAGTRVK